MVFHKLSGIGIGYEIAIAPAYILENQKIKVSDHLIIDPAAELLKLDDGIKQTLVDLNILKKHTLDSVGKKHADIFQVHCELLQDPEIISKIQSLINDQKYNVVFAVNQVMKEYIDIFSQIEDNYFRNRIIDLRDIFQKLIIYLSGSIPFDLNLINKSVILICEDIKPSQIAQINPSYVKGIVCAVGSKTSHSGILAKQLKIPVLLGVTDINKVVTKGEMLCIDSYKEEVLFKLTPMQIKKLEIIKLEREKEQITLLKFKNLPTLTKDNKPVKVESNIGNVEDVMAAVEQTADGIGLFRTEFLYMQQTNFPTEDDQLIAYKKILADMGNKPVVIRTLDIGGDKPLPYFKMKKELNPFLGYRAIRICLTQLKIFKPQLRALLRASVFGSLAIMFPMIATIDELKKVKIILEECKQELMEKNIPFSNNIEIGIMVEIPSVVMDIEKFAKYCDFFSIGTNDLIQYTMAADRMSTKVAYLYQPLNPSILKMIKLIIDGAHKHGK